MYTAFAYIAIFLIVRFTLPFWLNKDVLPRLQAFAPMPDHPGIYWTYQLSNIALLVIPSFLVITRATLSYYLGLSIYLIGLAMLFLAIKAFSETPKDTFVNQGIYQRSRHPMYLAYFCIYFGIGVMGQSIFYILILLLFQWAGHHVALAEEEWCLEKYGKDYRRYMNQVNRYL